MKKLLFILSLTLTFPHLTQAQELTFSDFVGTWNGRITSESFGGFDDPITMTIYEDGFYTESSGHLMPTIYPNTQQCEFEASTNRFHWWYLQTVYAGQYFYQHFYYEIMYFQNDTIEMHYNFWDDPQPYPEAGRIVLVKETAVGLVDHIPTTNKEKTLLRTTDLIGREVAPNTRGQILLFQYSDGTAEKKFISSNR